MTSATTTIATARLDLVPLTAASMSALLVGDRAQAAAELGATIPAGWPDAHDAGFLRLRLSELLSRPEAAEWLVRALVLRETGAMVGHVGFHGPPGVNALARSDAVELSYTVFAEHRSRGLAGEAAAAVLEWARREHGISTFVASIAPSNEPSLRVVRRLGFRHVGEHWDEHDGLEHEYLLEAGCGS